ELVVAGGRKLLLVADPGATLTRSIGTEAIITVRDDNTKLDIYDLALRNAPNGPDGFGLIIPAGAGSPTVGLTRVTVADNPGGGISVAGGALIVHRSAITGNAGGGVTITNALFEMTNNIIANNGTSMSTFGGVSLAQISLGGTHQLDFNTITANRG